ncbi:Dockerin type I repeat protein [Crateriforma conspicua]|uniref:Dockerin type I repeat protein n=1 Tax=Crateriforma conspicua TaxID=2527996 RepID=A0A5C5Y4Z4_9PLAN|nr:Dockerin type I repeat protein [Crateriforma conspicua]
MRKTNWRRCKLETLESRRPLAGFGGFASSSDPFPNSNTDFARVGDNTLFVRNEPASGAELWRSTDANGPAELVRDIRPGEIGSAIESLLSVGDSVFFTAQLPDSGRNLWRSDGTSEGTVRVSDHDIDGPLQVFGDRVVFYVPVDWYRGELWISDGTRSGTTLVTTLTDRFENGVGKLLTADQHRFYFEQGSRNYFVSDGTPAGTIQLSGESVDKIRSIESAHNLATGDIIFLELFNGNEIHFIQPDGTVASVEELFGVNVASPAVGQPFGDDFFFLVTNTIGNVLWRTDGSPQGTAAVETVAELPEGRWVNDRSLSSVGEFLLTRTSGKGGDAWAVFDTSTGVWREFAGAPHGGEITIAGKYAYYATRHNNCDQIIRLDPRTATWEISASLSPEDRLGELFVIQDQLFFSYFASSKFFGQSLQIHWIDDQGSWNRHSSFSYGSGDSHRLVSVNNNQTLILVQMNQNRLVIHRTDTTAENSLRRIASNHAPMTRAAVPRAADRHHLTRLDGRHFVFTTQDVFGSKVWISDGTALGTRIAFATDDISPQATIDELYVVANKAVFTVTPTERLGRSLWSVGVGSVPRAIYRPGDGFGHLFDVLGSVNDRVIFATHDDAGGQTIWRTNDDVSNIAALASGFPVVYRTDLLKQAVAGQRLFFRVDSVAPYNVRYQYASNYARSYSGWGTDLDLGRRPSPGIERALWSTDGTAFGTQKVVVPQDLVSEEILKSYGNSIKPVSDLASIRTDNSGLFLQIEGSNDFFEIPESLTQHGDPVPIGRLGDSWIFRISPPNSPFVRELWRLDDDGSQPERIILAPLDQIVISDSKIFFGVSELTDGVMAGLYVSDGTAAGTHLVPTISPLGGRSLTLDGFTANGSVVASGEATWVTDGTAEGSTLISDTRAWNIVILDDDFVLNYVNHPLIVDTIDVVDTASTVTISADTNQTSVSVDQIDFAASVSTEVHLNLERAVGEVVIDTASVAAGPARRLDLNVRYETRIRLINGPGDSVTYSDWPDGLMIQIDGLDICVRLNDSVSLIDDLGPRERRVITSDSGDLVRLKNVGDDPTFSINASGRLWNLQIAEKSHLSNQVVRFDLSRGSDRVIVDKSFDPFVAGGFTRPIDIRFTEPTNGIDHSTIIVPDTYESYFSSGRYIRYRLTEHPHIRLHFDIQNNPYQNPVDVYDTNADGVVTAFDALLVINRLHFANEAVGWSDWQGLYDVLGDGTVSAHDALMVINRLRRDATFEATDSFVDRSLLVEDDDPLRVQPTSNTLF